MKKILFAFAAITLMAGPALAQEKPSAKKKTAKEAACHKEGESCCKEEQAAKGKSCCMPMPSKAAAAMKSKSAKPAATAEKAKPAAKG
ncbi:hypothetical protein [Chitinophaga sp. YIM B06452]|uniref:hypothetical protein n=1 Tax=Chitinophaga sp. YIM B06452 TaxID=3082158 RepID=UPI0031FE5CEE